MMNDRARDLSLKGWQIVAGGRSVAETTGKSRSVSFAPRKGASKPLTPLQGVRARGPRSGGLRYATTPGYFLSALRAAKTSVAQLLVILLAATAVKQYYSTASVNQLRWILAPTTTAVELATGSRFVFESYAGYVNSEHTFVIAASCAGVNFLITAFLMLSLSRLWRDRSHNGPGKSGWKFIPFAAAGAYLTTVVANTVRIATAVRLHGSSIELGDLNPNQLHRLEGIVIYFGFLLLLFVVSERVLNHRQAGRRSIVRQSLFPLAIYYLSLIHI